MRRRRGSGRKTIYQWVSGSSTYDVLGGGTAIVAGTPRGFEIAGLFGAAQTGDPVSIGRFTVYRIVGEVFFLANGGASGDRFTVGVGFKVQDTSQFGYSATLVPDPCSAGDSQSQWMHLRHYQWVSNGGTSLMTPSPQITMPNGAFFDIKVRRVVRDNQELLMIASCRTNGAGGLFVVPYLRCLIGRVA